MTWPTLDPSASVTPWMAYQVARDEYVGQALTTGAVVVLVALVLIVFSLATIAVAVAFRRH